MEISNSNIEILSSIENKDFAKALSLLDIEIEKGSTNPLIYILKGHVIQISDVPGYSLEECEGLYIKSIELDNGYIDGYIELGAYYHAIQNDSKKALPYFMKAHSLCNSKSEEVLQLIQSALEDQIE